MGSLDNYLNGLDNKYSVQVQQIWDFAKYLDASQESFYMYLLMLVKQLKVFSDSNDIYCQRTKRALALELVT